MICEKMDLRTDALDLCPEAAHGWSTAGRAAVGGAQATENGANFASTNIKRDGVGAERLRRVGTPYPKLRAIAPNAAGLCTQGHPERNAISGRQARSRRVGICMPRSNAAGRARIGRPGGFLQRCPFGTPYGSIPDHLVRPAPTSQLKKLLGLSHWLQHG
jgi:hypothetical protein